jgi:hypothetical protein
MPAETQETAYSSSIASKGHHEKSEAEIEDHAGGSRPLKAR